MLPPPSQILHTFNTYTVPPILAHAHVSTIFQVTTLFFEEVILGSHDSSFSDGYDKEEAKSENYLMETNLPQKDTNDGRVPCKEQLSRGSGKNHALKNPIKDSRNEKTSFEGIKDLN